MNAKSELEKCRDQVDALAPPVEDGEGPVLVYLPHNGRDPNMPPGRYGNLVIYDPEQPPPWQE